METDQQFNARRRKAARRDNQNYSCMSELERGCDEARKILRRKRSDNVELRLAGAELKKAVRSLRSWLSTTQDSLQWQRRKFAIERGMRLKAERLLEEASAKLAKANELAVWREKGHAL